MRFGIMAMQIDALIPAGLSAGEVMAHIASFDQVRLVRHLAQNGFNPVELGGDLGMFIPHSFSGETISHLAVLKGEQGLSYTVHLPLWSVEPSTPLEPVRRGSVQALIETVRATQPLAPEVYVLHATGALAAEFYRMGVSEQARGLLLRQFQAAARLSLRALLAETGLPSRQVAIETIQFPFEMTLELAEELDLSICLDTGHLLAGFSGPLDLFDALERCLPRLGEIHLHDCPRQPPGQLGYGQDHRPLGKGDLDVARLLGRLEAGGFSGPVVFELRLEEALASLDRIRALRPA